MYRALTNAANNETAPSVEMQRQFWDQWNTAHRSAGFDGLMERQRDMAVAWVQRCARPTSILEVGCGTGWLANELSRFGDVTAMDLSPESIRLASERYPHIRFFAGDFDAVSFDRRFEFVTCADVIAHVPSHQDFVDRVASLLAPGGIFVVMTQNPFVWNRSSTLHKKGEGQIRDWPPAGRLRELFAKRFDLLDVTSIEPGGDRGILGLANSRWVAGVLRKVIGRQRQHSLYEKLLIGRELVVVGRRRAD